MENRVFSELVGAIYDCAIDVTCWPQTLGRICEHFQFRKGTIDLSRVPAMASLFNYNYGIDDQQARKMLSHYHGMPEVWGGLSATMSRPIDKVWVVSRILPQDELQQKAYYKEWVGPMGLVDGAALVLARDNSLFGSIRLATDSRRGIIDDDLVADLSLLLPHCQRAARISGLLDASIGAVRNFRAVIDAMAIPIVLISSECEVVHSNPRASEMLEAGLLLQARYGRLHSPVPGLQRAIANAVRQLVLDETTIPGSGVGLSVRGTDEAVHTLHLLPLAHGDLRGQLAGDAVAALFISSAPVEQHFARDVLQSTYALTRAEIGVFRLLVAGKSTRAIAAELGIASSTVRTHVLRLLDKTGTHRRADLIRLAHALSSPLASSATLSTPALQSS